MAAAEAIKQSVEKYYPGQYEQITLDIFCLLSSGFEKFVSSLYKNSSKHAKLSYKAFFEITNKTELVNTFDKKGYRLIKKNLQKLIDIGPDLVMSTYPFPVYSVSRFFAEKHHKVPFINIITDTGEVHASWICDRVDSYLVPTEETAFFLQERGVREKKIKTLGFAVKQNFYKKYDLNQTRKKLKIKDGHVVLYFMGNLGMGNGKEKLELIDKNCKDINILVVCGNNKNLFEKLNKCQYSNKVKIFGFVEDMAELMSISDAVITKAGGVSIMETITMKKPTIVTEVVPGQEEPNARFIESMGFGYVETRPEALAFKLKYLLTESEQKRISANYANYQLINKADERVADYLNSLL